MTLSKILANDRERIRRLSTLRERISAELRAVQDGTLPYVEHKRRVTADDVAKEFAISVTNANNRLAKLYRVGILERDQVPSRHGRKFVYRLVD